MHPLLAIGLGLPEITIILLVVAVLFGARRIPQVGEALGKGIRNFKRSVTGEDDIDVSPKQINEGDESAPAAPSSTETQTQEKS